MNMKTKLYYYLSNPQLTALLNEISNTGIPGLKAKTKLLLMALAKRDGFSTHDAYLSNSYKIRSKAFKEVRKSLVFKKEENTYKLISVDLEIQVNGYWDKTIRICEGMISPNGYLAKCVVNGVIGTSGSEAIEFPIHECDGEDYRRVVVERMRNVQMAVNYATELAVYINENIYKLTPADFQDWNIKIV